MAVSSSSPGATPLSKKADTQRMINGRDIEKSFDPNAGDLGRGRTDIKPEDVDLTGFSPYTSLTEPGVTDIPVQDGNTWRGFTREEKGKHFVVAFETKPIDYMKSYRSTATIRAVQYLHEAIPGIVCYGLPADLKEHGCDSSRKHQPHVHTTATGGMTVLKKGDWIMPVAGGPFEVSSDKNFRAGWDVEPVKEPVATDDAEPAEPAEQKRNWRGKVEDKTNGDKAAGASSKAE